MSVPHSWNERPADPEALAAAEDRVYHDLRDPYEWPDPGHNYRVAQARKPEPGRPLPRPTDIINTACGWDPGAA